MNPVSPSHHMSKSLSLFAQQQKHIRTHHPTLSLPISNLTANNNRKPFDSFQPLAAFLKITPS